MNIDSTGELRTHIEAASFSIQIGFTSTYFRSFLQLNLFLSSLNYNLSTILLSLTWGEKSLFRISDEFRIYNEFEFLRIVDFWWIFKLSIWQCSPHCQHYSTLHQNSNIRNISKFSQNIGDIWPSVDCVIFSCQTYHEISSLYKAVHRLFTRILMGFSQEMASSGLAASSYIPNLYILTRTFILNSFNVPRSEAEALPLSQFSLFQTRLYNKQLTGLRQCS